MSASTSNLQDEAEALRGALLACRAVLRFVDADRPLGPTATPREKALSTAYHKVDDAISKSQMGPGIFTRDILSAYTECLDDRWFKIYSTLQTQRPIQVARPMTTIKQEESTELAAEPARLQVLFIPNGDEWALVLSGCHEQEEEPLEGLRTFAKQCGAKAVWVTPLAVDA